MRHFPQLLFERRIAVTEFDVALIIPMLTDMQQ